MINKELLTSIRTIILIAIFILFTIYLISSDPNIVGPY